MLLDQLRRNLRYVLMGLGVVIGTALLMGSVFTVEPEEKAVVLRFGEPLDREFNSGLHFKIPIVDQVFIVPVERQHRLEIGFRSVSGKVTQVDETGYDRESLMLTGDLSLAHVQWSVLYKIKDINKYLFNVKEPEDTVKDVAMGVMRQVIGDYSLDEMLTDKYREIEDHAKRLTQHALDGVESGIQVTSLKLLKTEVPREAKQAFDNLNRSVAEVQRNIVQAYAERDDVLGKADQERLQAIGAAESRRSRVLENAKGEASAFSAKLKQYTAVPAITRQWMYLESMSRVLAATGQKIILEGGHAGPDVMKILPLDDFMRAPKLEQPTPRSPTTSGQPAAAAPGPRVRGGGAK